MTVKPVFMDDFKCVAGACTDTCCKGWEIDVDEYTLDYYNEIPGDVGEFVRSRLINGEGVKLCLEGQRCRFLRDDNLCELILRLGEDALCDICREHPRFYSEGENICEAGVGLCCPEAARMWLELPIDFILEEDGYTLGEDEEQCLQKQLGVIDFILHGDGTLGERFQSLLGAEHGENTYDDLCSLYSSLEALDEDFGKSFSPTLKIATDGRFANLGAYFIYRYWFLLGGEMAVKFAAASLIIISAMGGDLLTNAKDYSKEVEYDPDNLDLIYAHLEPLGTLGELCAKVFIK